MALRVRVCRIDEVPAGEVRGFDVEGVTFPVLVANIDGVFYASTSMCPHEEVSLLGGHNVGTVLICPGHAYEFDLRDGSCGHDVNLRLHCYQVSIEADELFVDII